MHNFPCAQASTSNGFACTKSCAQKLMIYESLTHKASQRFNMECFAKIVENYNYILKAVCLIFERVLNLPISQ